MSHHTPAEKWVAITGASSGIGEAAALAFAGRGYSVALIARRHDRLEQVAARVQAMSGGDARLNTRVIVADLSSDAGIDHTLERLRDLKLEILIHNAGMIGPIAPLAERVEVDGELRLRVQCGEAFARSCLPKGSVTLDGVSLTVAELAADSFVVALVPHTLERTTLGERVVGDHLNLEPDMIGQWVLRAVELQTAD